MSNYVSFIHSSPTTPAQIITENLLAASMQIFQIERGLGSGSDLSSLVNRTNELVTFSEKTSDSILEKINAFAITFVPADIKTAILETKENEIDPEDTYFEHEEEWIQLKQLV